MAISTARIEHITRRVANKPPGSKHAAKHKARDKAQATKGKLKKAAGKAAADPVLQDERQAGLVKGDLKQAGEKAKEPAGKLAPSRASG